MAWSGYSESGQGSEERGPGTFALQLPGMPRATAKPTPQNAPRVGTVGGQSSMSNNIRSGTGAIGKSGMSQGAIPTVRVQSDPTAELLFKLGGAKAAELVAKREQELYVRGASRAASGEAMVEIANEQPWISKVFGDTALVEGARAYSVKAGVAKWSTEHLLNMKELRKMTPDSVPGYINNTIHQSMTGDPETDRQIQAEYLGQLPQLIKEHTRQHYLYRQEQAKEARDSAIDNILLRNEAYETHSIIPDAAASERHDIEATDVLMPAPGADVGAHWAAVSERIGASLDSGNVYTYKLIRDNGVLSAMPPEFQYKARKAVERAAPPALAKAQMLLMDDLVALNRDAKMMTPAQLREEYARINDAAEGISGIPQDVAQMVGLPAQLRGLTDLDRMQDAARASAEKETRTAVGEAAVAAALDAHRPDQLRAARMEYGITPAQEDRIAAAKLMSMAPEARGRWLADAAKVDIVHPMGVDMINVMMEKVRSGTATPEETMGAIQMWRQFDGNVEGRALYFKGGRDQDMAAIESGYRATGNVEVAAMQHAATKNLLQRGYAKPTAIRKEVKSAIEKEVKSQFDTGIFGTVMGMLDSAINAGQVTPKAKASETELNMMASIVENEAYVNPLAENDPVRAAQAGVKATKAAGMWSPAGSRFVFNMDPQSASRWTLDQALGGGEPTSNHMMLAKALDEASSAVGMTPDSRVTFRMPTKPGEPIVYRMIGRDSDDNEVYAYTTTDAVSAHIDKATQIAKDAIAEKKRLDGLGETGREFEQQMQQGINTQMGPPIQ